MSEDIELYNEVKFVELQNLSDERITTEILVYKEQVGNGIIEIGKRLIEMKRRVGHGNWENYLKDKVDFSDRTARRFMNIAQEYSNRTSMAVLGVNKLYALLDIPSEDREEFIDKPHLVNGVEKTVDEMTTRELQKIIKEKEESERQTAEYKKLSENLVEMINEKNNTISTIQFELGYERSKKQPEVVEKIVEKVVEVIPPNIKREVEQKQLNITNLTTQVQLAEKQISTLESEMNKLKSENAKLQDLKAKENEIKKTYLEVDNLKKQMSEHRTEIEQTTKLLHFYDKLDSFLATEMYPVVSQFTISRLSDQTKIKGENIIENLNNWIFAFTNKYLKV